MRSRLLAASVAMLVVSACGGGEAAKAGEGALDEADQFFLQSVKKDLVEIKGALAKGDDPKFTCVAATSYGEKLTGKNNAEAETVVKEVTALCNYDVPLKAMETAVTQAEVARRAKPNEGVLSECFNADFGMSTETLTKNNFAADEKVTALTARWKAACPSRK